MSKSKEINGKVDVKFHVESGKIIHSGTSDIMSMKWVAETLTEFFKKSSINLAKANENKKTINAFVATGLGDVDIIPFSKVVRIKDYPLKVEVYFGLGECSYITFSDSERIQINAYKKWLDN